MLNFDEIKTEITFRTARAGGAGGQNVNKVETKVELLFDINASKFLSEYQKKAISKNLANRINKNGVLSISCQEKRTQLLNKTQVWRIFEKLLTKATTPPKKRNYKAPKANEKTRLANKKHKSDKKTLRKKPEL